MTAGARKDSGKGLDSDKAKGKGKLWATREGEKGKPETQDTVGRGLLLY